MQWGHFCASSSVHFLRSSSWLAVLSFDSSSLIFGLVFSRCSKFLQSASSLHWLQSVRLFPSAQIRILQVGGPPPFLQPEHNCIASMQARPFIKSLKTKSLEAHLSNAGWLRLTICSYFLVSSCTAPLPPKQLPHQIPQK